MKRGGPLKLKANVSQPKKGELFENQCHCLADCGNFGATVMPRLITILPLGLYSSTVASSSSSLFSRELMYSLVNSVFSLFCLKKP